MPETIERMKGRIVGFDEKRNVLIIEANYSDYNTLCRREYAECYIEPIDSRPLSSKQRRSCYAMIHEIADYSGDSTESMKHFLKMEFWTTELMQVADRLFSLSNAPMSVVAEFQSWLARFIVTHDIPTKKPMTDYVDDIADYTYACVINRKCPVCGRTADLHHIDAVGMGRDRDTIIHEGLEVITLCRNHHNEIHRIGKTAFAEKYHLSGGVICDKEICRIYGLKRRRENEL